MKHKRTLSTLVIFVIWIAVNGVMANGNSLLFASGAGIDMKNLEMPWVKTDVYNTETRALKSTETIMLAELKKEVKAGKKVLAPVTQLEAEQQEARKKEQTEIERLKAELKDLDTEAAGSDKSLDFMYDIVCRRKEVQEKLEKLIKKHQKEDKKRLKKINRLKEEVKKEDIRKYQEIISSPFGKDMKSDAFETLISKYPEMKDEIGSMHTEKSLPEKSTGKVTESLGMKFVLIQPGTFMMGSPADEPMRDDDETQHQVTLTKGFYLQTTEVSQGQWRSIMGNNPSYFKDCGDECPVECVSWNDCQEFIQRLNNQEGTENYRLPTEAEWEFACRAGGTKAFANGEMIARRCGHDPNLDDMGWYCGNSGKTTNPVRQKNPNDWGTYDMHGNVWEWCQDLYGEYPSDHIVDPAGPSSGLRRVFRGGGWLHNISHCRSANRFRDTHGFNSRYVGFRLAKTP